MTEAETQQLRGRVRCILGYCEASQHDCVYESSRNASQELDLIMAEFTKAHNATLNELVDAWPNPIKIADDQHCSGCYSNAGYNRGLEVGRNHIKRKLIRGQDEE